MPRRYYDYDPRSELMHQLSSLGAFIMGLALFSSSVNLVHLAEEGQEGPEQSLGRHHPRVAGLFAAAALQLPNRPADSHPRTLRVRRSG